MQYEDNYLYNILNHKIKNICLELSDLTHSRDTMHFVELSYILPKCFMD